MRCQGCTERHPGCHSDCPDYKAFRAAIEAKKSAIKEDYEKCTSKITATRPRRRGGKR